MEKINYCLIIIWYLILQNVPHIDFRLSNNTKKMVCSYQKMLSKIKLLINHESARENNGVSQYAGHANPIQTDRGEQQHIHRTSMLPMGETKYFIIVMHPAEDRRKHKPAKFLFRLKSLYLDGFLHDNIWQLFKGTRLAGVDEAASSQWSRELTFKCNYNDLKPDYFNLRTGLYGQEETLSAITSYGTIDIEEVKIGLSRTIATVSEATRFPSLSRHIMFGFNSGENVPVDDIEQLEGQPGWKSFSYIVTNWKINCKRVLRGQEKFTPVPGFPTYESVVDHIGVSLCITELD
uniref:rRNA N-glycosylase n=2 Tax=Aegilops tauschii subsp. strangulata TaxID=200361 RepID=A0A452Y0V9_AEGTS